LKGKVSIWQEIAKVGRTAIVDDEAVKANLHLVMATPHLREGEGAIIGGVCHIITPNELDEGAGGGSEGDRQV
jgi:hypothetical protein